MFLFLLISIFILFLCIQHFIVRRRRREKGNKDFSSKPFSSMPGPPSYPIIGTLPLYIYYKKYSLNRLHWNGRSKEYHWTVFNKEGKYPSRRSHTALAYYRSSRPQKYSTTGLLPTNGAEWRRVRTLLQKPANRTSISGLISSLNLVAEEFVEYMDRHFICVNKDDFLDHLNRVFLEMTGVVTFDTRLNSLQNPLQRILYSKTESSIPYRLIKAAEETNDKILETDNNLPTWKIWETKPFKMIRESQEYIEKISSQLIQDKKSQHMQEDCPRTLLDHWLSSTGLNDKDIMTGAAEFLLAGIHTSSYTFSFLLYHLANNIQAQERLRNECLELKSEFGEISREYLHRAVYAKACLKESLRLNPVSVGVGRILPEDTVLGGYLVPKGTLAVTQNQVICRFAEFFEQPNSFIPERWIEGEIMHKEVDPFISIPFGYGIRQCIGKNIAEISLQVLLMNMVSRFSWSWAGTKDLDTVSLLINKPDQPIRLKFKKID
ncbi:cytochrome P450 302a1, mitochondrial [Eurytemora carolleeae]|uniref:cytochrome P450 302a1, mitochondrial n=1 Tax=Eurytemora carolleeae TaxID=1294199 RepID=UPI000C77B506|nr:cytochrome P450 302a1, mitochondrial [Eurytemora carolleeae]|eukprot:XP_023335363.1 cytochrome P450 302a1, mitochondrial-like [Eurytemora affinis]